jgi:hypothetical protein
MKITYEQVPTFFQATIITKAPRGWQRTARRWKMLLRKTRLKWLRWEKFKRRAESQVVKSDESGSAKQ